MVQILCGKLFITDERLRSFGKWMNAKRKKGYCDLKMRNAGKVPHCSHMQNVGDEKYMRVSSLST